MNHLRCCKNKNIFKNWVSFQKKNAKSQFKGESKRKKIKMSTADDLSNVLLAADDDGNSREQKLQDDVPEALNDDHIAAFTELRRAVASHFKEVSAGRMLFYSVPLLPGCSEPSLRKKLKITPLHESEQNFIPPAIAKCSRCTRFLDNYGTLVYVEETTGKVRSALWGMNLDLVPTEFKEFVRACNDHVESNCKLEGDLVVKPTDRAYLGCAQNAHGAYWHFSVNFGPNCRSASMTVDQGWDRYDDVCNIVNPISNQSLHSVSKLFQMVQSTGNEARKQLAQRLVDAVLLSRGDSESGGGNRKDFRTLPRDGGSRAQPGHVNALWLLCFENNIKPNLFRKTLHDLWTATRLFHRIGIIH